MPTHLKKLKIGELSLVRRPANQGAESLLHKMDDTKPTLVERFVSLFHPIDKGDDGDEVTPLEDEDETLTKSLALHVSVDSIINDEAMSPADRLAKLDETVTQYREAVAELPQFTQSEIPVDDISKAAVEKAENERDALQKKLDDITKAQATEKRLTLAKSLATGTNVKPETVAVLLEKAGDDADAQAAVAELLGKNAAAIKDGKIVEEIGKTVPTGTEPTPTEQLQKYADEFRKADATLTGPQAFAKAMEAHQDLYEASLTR